MKKTLRIITAIALVVVMCFSLTGCTIIDELRATQAYFNEDMNIVLGEDIYKPVLNCSFLYPDYYGEGAKGINITEKDLPVLLSNFMCSSADLSADGNFIDSYYEVEYSNYESGSYVYCKSDVYDEVVDIIESGITSPDGYRYSYYDYEDYEQKYRVLTEKEIQVVDSVIKDIEAVSSEEYSDNYEVSVPIYAFVEDLPFQNYRYSIIKYGGWYFVEELVIPEGLTAAEVEDYYANYGENYYEGVAEYTWKKVPKDYYDTFDAIVQKYVESENYYYW